MIVIAKRKYIRIWLLKQIASRHAFQEIGVER